MVWCPEDEEMEGDEGEDDLELIGDEFPSDMMDDDDEDEEGGESDEGACEAGPCWRGEGDRVCRPCTGGQQGGYA